MRTSAKLNLFLGVRNRGERFLPDHLRYLEGFLRRRRMNVLFPFSIVLGTAATVWLAQRAAAGVTAFEMTGAALVAALLGLAVIEHGFMMIPVSIESLWSWGFRSRVAASPRRSV
jgi:putative photosynthetic complex assembly protein 2